MPDPRTFPVRVFLCGSAGLLRQTKPGGYLPNGKHFQPVVLKFVEEKLQPIRMYSRKPRDEVLLRGPPLFFVRAAASQQRRTGVFNFAKGGMSPHYVKFNEPRICLLITIT